MIHRIARLVALLALFVALLDAARLLGIGAPIVDLADPKGAVSFGVLGIFTLGRLFAGVGIWIESNWGNVLSPEKRGRKDYGEVHRTTLFLRSSPGWTAMSSRRG